MFFACHPRTQLRGISIVPISVVEQPRTIGERDRIGSGEADWRPADKPLLAPYVCVLTELTASNKGITLAELREAVVARGGPRVDLSTVWHMLRRLGLTHKKSR